MAKILTDIEIVGKLAIESTSGNQLSIKSIGEKAWTFSSVYGYTNADLNFSIDGSTKMTLNANGYLGIGTVNPERILDVSKSINDSLFFGIRNPNTGSAVRSGFSISNGDYAGDSFTFFLGGKNYTGVSAWQNRAVFSSDSGVLGGLLLRPSLGGFQVTADGSLNNPNLFVNTSGNVGIGKTNPSEALDVVGNIKATSFIKSGGTSSQFLKADGTVDSNVFSLDSNVVHLTGAETISGDKTFTGRALFSNKYPIIDSTSGASSLLLFRNNGVNKFIMGSDGGITGTVPDDYALYVYGNNNLDFCTDAAKRLRVAGNGNILINTTTNNNVDKLQVNGTVTFGAGTTANHGVIKSQLDTKANSSTTIFGYGITDSFLGNRTKNLTEINDFALPQGNYKVEEYAISGLPNTFNSIINLGKYSGAGHAQQLAIPFADGTHKGMYLRTSNATTWNDWYKLWDSKDFSQTNITAWNNAEPSFTKNTGFNKNFGIVAGTVAEGNAPQIAVDNIIVGGRNIILNSPNFLMTNSDNGNTLSIIENDYVKITFTNSGNIYGFIKTSMDRIQGEDYVVSFEVLSTANYGVYFYSNGSQVFPSVIKNTLGLWERVSIPYKPTGATTNKNTVILFGFYGGIAGNVLKYRNLKLERGNKSTAWTPAPEDQVSDFNQSDVNAFNYIKNKPSLNYVNNSYLNVQSIADANDADNVGVQANFLSGSNKPSGVIDGSLLTLSYSTSFSTQMFGDWRTKDLYFRTQEGGNWKTWTKFWNTDNFSQFDINTWNAKVSNVTHTGEVTGSGYLTIANNVITDSKIAINAISFTRMQQIRSQRLLGRAEAGNGDIQEIRIGSGLTLDQSTGELSASGTSSVSTFLELKDGIDTTGKLQTSKILNDWITDKNLASVSSVTAKADKTLLINTSFGLLGGGNLSANRTLYVDFGTNLGQVPHGNDSRINNGQTSFTWGNHKENNTNQYLAGDYVSAGVQKPNSPYFGLGKLKLQMLAGSNLGVSDVWNDVLWISSYSGGGINGSNALIMSKMGERIGFAYQDATSASWGTYREIFHTGNFNPNSKLSIETTSNFNNITGNKLIEANTANPLNAPVANNYGQGIQFSDYAPNANQLVFSLVGDLFIRNKLNGNFGSWDEVITTKNLNRQIPINVSTTAQASWNGFTLIFGANITITIPNTIAVEYAFDFWVLPGFTVTWVLASPLSYIGPDPVIAWGGTELYTGVLQRLGSSNTILYKGS